MVGIAVISHGSLCEGILDSVSMVAGTMKQTESISLQPGENPDSYQNRVKRAVERLDTGDGVLVLLDLIGGTPFNTICMLSQELNIHIVTGMNLAMLITAALERTEDITMDMLAEKVEKAGAQGIRSLRRE